MFDTSEAGHRLRDVRLAKDNKQEDLVQSAQKYFGPEDAINRMTISRLETGYTKNPALGDVAQLAYVLGLPLARVAQWYGLPAHDIPLSEPEEDIVKRLKTVAQQLPEQERNALYARIIFDIATALD